MSYYDKQFKDIEAQASEYLSVKIFGVESSTNYLTINRDQLDNIKHILKENEEYTPSLVGSLRW